MKKNTEEDIQDESSSKDERILEEQRISFSAKLVSCLESKKKGYNKKNKSNIKIEQLKDIYIRGARYSNQDLNLNGLARINMFLRMKEQKMMGIVSAKIEKIEELSSLVLETENLQELQTFVDVSDSWAPREEDYTSAKEDIEKYDLNFDFKSVSELYLEPYIPIQLNWE
jgi:hypothetical protein